MTSTYLSMRATKATPGRALRFERGRPIAEFSVGSRGVWRASAPGVGDRHVWVSFDGQCLVLRRDNGREAVVVDGRPLTLTPQRIVRLPCRVELGEARLVVDDQVPPLAVLDASTIARVVAGRTEVGRAKTEASAAEAEAFSGGQPDGLVPARREQILADGHATSVMPLEVLIQRGLAAAAHARQPHDARRRRRKAHREFPRRSPTSAVAAWPARLGRWFVVLIRKAQRAPAQQGRVAPARQRLLALALLAPLLAVLCQVLASGSVESSTDSAPLEESAAIDTRETIVAVANAADSALAAKDLAPSASVASAGPTIAVVPPSDVRDAAEGPQTARFDEPEVPPDASKPPAAARTRADATSRPTSERLAIDALAAGDLARAQALYVSLASRARDNVAFAEAARILSSERDAANRAGGADIGVVGVRTIGSDPKQARLADGLVTRAR
jgi:hypothetical protein